MLNADMNAFRDDALPDLLVYDDSNGPRVDVEHSSGSAVVVLIGHTLMDGAVDHNIHNVSNFVGGEGLGNVDGSVLLEPLFEFVSGSALVTVAMRHGSQIL